MNGNSGCGMKRPFLAATAMFFCMNADSAQAQFRTGPTRAVGGRGVAPGYRGSGLAWGYPHRDGFVPLGGFPFFPFSPLAWSALLAPPITISPSPTVVLPPIVLNGGDANPDLVNPLPGPLPLPRENDFPQGAKPGDHIVIRPKKELPLLPPPEPIPLAPKADRVAPPVPRPPVMGIDPFAKRKVVNVDKADPDPVKEVARLVKLGKTAFAAEEFGAASEQFDRAIAVDPKSALPVFLKAQAAFASGRYGDAVTAIRAGLALDRTWPASPFDPKELYGANPALFADHLAALREVVAANPSDASLQFLIGYELWFIGEKVEARKWFDLAEKRLPAPGPIALFK
jgi:hypothetical protein